MSVAEKRRRRIRPLTGKERFVDELKRKDLVQGQIPIVPWNGGNKDDRINASIENGLPRDGLNECFSRERVRPNTSQGFAGPRKWVVQDNDRVHQVHDLLKAQSEQIIELRSRSEERARLLAEKVEEVKMLKAALDQTNQDRDRFSEWERNDSIDVDHQFEVEKRRLLARVDVKTKVLEQLNHSFSVISMEKRQLQAKFERIERIFVDRNPDKTKYDQDDIVAYFESMHELLSGSEREAKRWKSKYQALLQQRPEQRRQKPPWIPAWRNPS